MRLFSCLMPREGRFFNGSSAERAGNARSGVAGGIVAARVLRIPASAAMAAIACWLGRFIL